MSECILSVKNLTKIYKNRVAVDNLNLTVYNQEILGLLGPNGAGKSTTINILSTILKQDGGEIEYFGKAIDGNRKDIKKNIGIVPQELALYEDVPAYKNVEFFATLYGLKGEELRSRVNDALAFVGLTERKNDLPKTFSGGMKRRLNIACSIAHNPKLLILDEPTVGIDPQSRNHILDSIKKIRNQGTTVIYTTHYMEEVEAISDRIIIMDKGKKIAEGTINQLLEEFEHKRSYSIFVKEEIKEQSLKETLLSNCVEKVEVYDKMLKIIVNKQEENLGTIITELVKRGYTILHISSEEGNLESVFLDLTGRRLRD